jgi:hypothetical protein
MADTLTPPGLGRITRCGECEGRGHYRSGTECAGCRGDGRELWRACPRCGDIAWDKRSDGTYECRISCGYIWTEEHPGWVIQVLPAA